jgi:hypothetical protein
LAEGAGALAMDTAVAYIHGLEILPMGFPPIEMIGAENAEEFHPVRW